MEIHKDKQQEKFTLMVSRDELTEKRDALGVRGLYLEALGRKKVKIARAKDLADANGAREIQKDRSRNMYMQIVKEME
ncbi:MAG: hypothetical protein WC556_00395 [Candidatus Methanoperedens sp.]